MTKLEKEAYEYAKEMHKDQIRKFVNQPYFDAHILKVNSIVKNYSRSEILSCSSLLHDVIEDSFEDIDVGYNVLLRKFGKKIADIVLELTSDKEEIEKYTTKADYLIIKMIHMSNSALIIKLADRLQNISDAFTATERFRYKYYKETSKIMDELGDNRRYNRTQFLLAYEIKMKLDNIRKIFKY
jgi:(p)ppGpp synthase/HD superfamily hydrolase